MSTWIAFYVEGADARDVAECCAAWMRERQRGIFTALRGGVQVHAEAFTPAMLSIAVLLGRPPTRVLVHRQAPNWIAVLCNNDSPSNTLAEHVSRVCGRIVVDTMGQTAADVYAIVVHDRGRTIRRLEYSRDEGWITKTGEPLRGEPTPLEWCDPDEPDDEEGTFDHHAVERYLRDVFGLAWWESPREGAPVLVVG